MSRYNPTLHERTLSRDRAKRMAHRAFVAARHLTIPKPEIPAPLFPFLEIRHGVAIFDSPNGQHISFSADVLVKLTKGLQNDMWNGVLPPALRGQYYANMRTLCLMLG